MENSDTSTNTVWHSLPANAVLDDLKCSSEGLTQSEVETRFVKYGANRLPQAARRNVFVRFLLHFNNILIYVLLGAALITALLGF